MLTFRGNCDVIVSFGSLGVNDPTLELHNFYNEQKGIRKRKGKKNRRYLKQMITRENVKIIMTNVMIQMMKLTSPLSTSLNMKINSFQ